MQQDQPMGIYIALLMGEDQGRLLSYNVLAQEMLRDASGAPLYVAWFQ